MRETRPPQGAQAALRAIRLLKLFTAERAEMSLSELSRGSGLNKTTTHRLLRALQSENLIERNAAGAPLSQRRGIWKFEVSSDVGGELCATATILCADR